MQRIAARKMHEIISVWAEMRELTKNVRVSREMRDLACLNLTDVLVDACNVM